MTRESFSEERGAVLVIVAAGMFAFAMFVAFVVDTANWYQHKRHLQLQADAAAFAGAHSLTAGGCSDSLVAGDAHAYGGSYSPDGTTVISEPYNNQIGGTDARKVHVLINSSAYYGDPGAGDNTDPNGSPCAAKYLDIKATETSLPWFIGFGGLVQKISAHARVGLFKESQSSGTLPIAVPNPLPTSAAAIFIDETTSPPTVLATARLGHVGPSGSLDMWSNAPGIAIPKCSTTTSAAAVTPPSRATGIIIAISGRSCLSVSGSVASICGQSLTDCFDSSSDPPTRGVSFIRGYATGGNGNQPNAPLVRSVELVPIQCRNAYFANNTTDCTYDLVARISAAFSDGSIIPNANQIYKANGATLDPSPDPNCAVVAGADTCWHATLTLPAKSSANTITMTWEETTGCLNAPCSDKSTTVCKTGNGNKCTGNFEGGGVIQRAYAATDSTSGPLKIVDLCNVDVDSTCVDPKAASQSYPAGDSHHFVVSVGVGGTLQNATSVSDPLVALRIRSGQQSLDCDPGLQNLKQELAQGCSPTYTPNTGTPDCSTIGTSALWASTQPWSCIAVSTGRQPNDVAAGLNQRLFGTDKPTASACLGLGTAGYNNWANFDQNYVPTGPADPRGQDGFPPGDPRVLDAYITTYGAFSHVNGTSGSVPVVGFGHFYVTGYTGQGGGFDPPTNCGSDPVPNNDTGLIVGHFIRYVDTVGGFGTDPCDPNSINACVVVMTK